MPPSSKGIQKRSKRLSPIRGDRVAPIIGAAVSDLAGLISWVPATNLLGKAVEAVIERRREVARAILLEELRKGCVCIDDPDSAIDEFVQIAHAYFRAADEGAARRNLILLAKIISGQANSGSFSAEDFLSWTVILSTLSKNELIVIAVVAALFDGRPPRELPSEGHTWLSYKSVCDAAIPTYSQNTADLAAALGSLQRTGLLISSSVWGGTGYWPSPRMRDLVDLTQLDLTSVDLT